MAIKAIHEWDTNPNDNDFVGAEGGFAELMPRSDVNDAMRIHIAEIRKHYNDSEWIKVRTVGPDLADIGVFARVSASEFTINLASTDLTGFFGEARIIKIIDGSGAGVDLVTQVGTPAAAYNGSNLTTVNIKTGAALDILSSDVYAHSNSILRSIGLLDAVDQFYIPASADSQGINDAIALADAAGGGTVMLIDTTYTINNAGGAIDLAGKGNVILQGSGPETQLIQGNGENMNALINLGNGSKPNSIRDIAINVDRGNNPAGNGYGIEVSGALRSRIDRVLFLNVQVGVHITSTAMADLYITGCFFASYREFGIAGTASTDSHFGHITNNRFSGSAVAAATAAAIKVAGAWNISSNRVRDVGHASLVTKGIWMWPKSASNTGGRESTISGNLVVSGSPINGTMIEIGGDECSVVGNHVEASLSAIGIHLNSTSAGQLGAANVVTGNNVTGGKPIVANVRSKDAVISGNSIAPGVGLVGIESDGDHPVIAANAIRAGATGVKLTGNSTTPKVHGNMISLPTSSGILLDGACSEASVAGNTIDSLGIGVSIGASVLNAVVRGNSIPTSTTDISDSGTNTVKWNNESDQIAVEVSATGPATNGSEVMSNIDGADLPYNGGRGTYLIFLSYESNGSNSNTATLYFGPNGNLSDTPVFTISAAAGTFAYSNTGSYAIVTVGTALKFGVSIQSVTSANSRNIECKIMKVGN